MSGEVDACPSCLEGYNGSERVPKILSCYHTYCRLCIEQFMFADGVVSCLSCSEITNAASVALIPENPYFRSTNGAEISAGDEDVYYSDSDGDDDSSIAQSNSKDEVGSNENHVQGVKEMVLNTQRANIAKVKQLIDLNLRKINSSLALRNSREIKIKETLQALTDFRDRIAEEHKGVLTETNELNSYKAKLETTRKQLNNVNLMDYTTLKSLNDGCLSIKSKLNVELEKVHKTELERAIRQSTVKINFNDTDHLLNSLKADNDTIFIKLSSVLGPDPSLVYLTTFMLGKIFTDKIASSNPSFKDLVKNAYSEDGLNGPLALDDPTEYIDYVKSFQSINLDPPVTAINGSESSRSASPPEEREEWKVVEKVKKEPKKLMSFSEMAKKPGNPDAVKRLPYPEKTSRYTNRPHCYFKIQVDNDIPFRVLIELRPDMAPKMSDNFKKLSIGLADGRGYAGSRIFRAKMNDHILGGDFENDDGTGGHSAYDDKYFLAEQCPLKDHKGAIRMKGLERTIDGRCKIGSQFMIWVGDLEYKEYRFTLVFGKVVEGFDQLLEISRIKAVQKSPTSWILRQSVTIIESGVL